MAHMNFITTRARLWTRLEELARIEVKTEGERAEECVKAREFGEWSSVENRLKNPILHFDPHIQTPLQNRIMMAARTNSSVC